MTKSAYNKLILVVVSVLIWFAPLNESGRFSAPDAQAAVSPDAIALRIIPNTEHLSSADWYKANIKIQGSPQALTVDGYDAIRDGRTVYVNAANIDLAGNRFYNNIYLLSFSQEAEKFTEDIFGQLLAQWKFNANITDAGQKNKIRNDTRRLADLSRLRLALDKYKDGHGGNYPVLAAGSYLAGKTISTWPSWQATLGNILGFALPLDPINQLGACPAGFDVKTCWNQSEKKFATDLNQLILPSGSRAYVYSVTNQGKNLTLCAQLETNYSNIASFNCFADQLPNNAPIIKSINLSGWPYQKFTGYASVIDPDENHLTFSVELVKPATAAGWAADGWQWETGAPGFVVRTTNVPGQVTINAARAGRAGLIDRYQVRFIVNDGQNQPNSIVSQLVNVQISPYPMELGSLNNSLAIGENRTFTVVGLDSSRQPISSITVNDFFLDGAPVNMAAHGFSINGANLMINHTTSQRTGIYRGNITGIDTATGATVDSFFQVNLINNPPNIHNLTARFANNTEQVCAANCEFAIDNGETAIIRVAATDSDPGHTVKYEFVGDAAGLAINQTTGVISGLENLNRNQLTDRIYNLRVRASDQYCTQSKPEECSKEIPFGLRVNRFCSLSVPASTIAVNLPGPYRIDQPGQKLNLGDNLLNCASVTDGKVDVTYNGSIRSRAIVFVLDLSGSMTTSVNGTEAYLQLKDSLVKNNGVFDKLFAVASSSPPGYFIKVGLVAYNASVYPYPANLQMVNIIAPGELANLKDEVDYYQANGGTNTLAALNRAEQMLANVTESEVDKYIVLMSDGIPTVVRPAGGVTDPGYCQLLPCGCVPPLQRDANGNCVNRACNPPCPPPTDHSYFWCDNCGKCHEMEDGPPSDPCDPPLCGNKPNCSPKTTCCDGTTTCGGCPQCPSYEKKSIFDDFLSIFLPEKALALTNQTRCLPNYSDLRCTRCTEPGYDNYTCSYDWGDINCDISYDVGVEAQALKGNGVKIYSIYYNTSGSLSPAANMRAWSSDNGTNAGNYFISGNNIDQMFNEALSAITKKPKNVKVGAVEITDDLPYFNVNTVYDVDISSAITCGLTQLPVDFLPSAPSYLEFTRLRFNYCPPKLHP